MFDFPPQHLECFYAQSATETNVSTMMSVASFSETDIVTFAQHLLQEFPQGLTWSDIPSLVENTINLFEQEFGPINYQQLMNSIISKAVDLSNSVYLSNPLSSTVFKDVSYALLSFVYEKDQLTAPVSTAATKADFSLEDLTQLASTLVSEAASTETQPTTGPTQEQLKQYAVNLQMLFTDGFQAQDIVELIVDCHTIVASISGLSTQDQRTCMIEIIDDFIDITDIPYIPDFLVDPLFKLAAPSLVDYILEKTNPQPATT